jgi:hypothetical protein
LVRLAPSLGWELLAFAREVEAREEFHLGERQADIVPDAFVAIREEEADYHAMVEIDRGTMSIPRLSRKLLLYLGGWPPGCGRSAIRTHRRCSCSRPPLGASSRSWPRPRSGAGPPAGRGRCLRSPERGRRRGVG